MAADLAAIGVVEQRGRQRRGAHVLPETPATVEQDVIQTQPRSFQKAIDLPFPLALIDEQKQGVAFPGLGVSQHRHLAPTRRTPGRPEIDHQWLTGIILQRHRTPLVVAQGHFRQPRALLEGVPGQVTEAPAEDSHRQRDAQRLAQFAVAPAPPDAQRQRGDQTGPGDEAAVTDIDDAQPVIPVVRPVHRHEGQACHAQRHQQQAKQLPLRVAFAAAADPPAGQGRQQQAAQQNHMGHRQGQRPDIHSQHQPRSRVWFQFCRKSPAPISPVVRRSRRSTPSGPIHSSVGGPSTW